tara:strand:- start:27 stop:488 length:462 start_codon:yes stop_codon:yes gene_type:complete
MPLTLEDLQKLKKKYHIVGPQKKKTIATALWHVSGRAMTTKDLQDILYLLGTKNKKVVKTLIQKRENKPITNYRGMWKPKTESISKMKKDMIIKQIKSFVRAWMKVTTRASGLGDLNDLKNEDIKTLRSLLTFYYSKDAKLMAEDWLRRYKPN